MTLGFLLLCSATFGSAHDRPVARLLDRQVGRLLFTRYLKLQDSTLAEKEAQEDDVDERLVERVEAEVAQVLHASAHIVPLAVPVVEQRRDQVEQ